MKLVYTTIAVCFLCRLAFSHPIQEDDLLQPKLKIVSRSPMTIIVTLKPRINVSDVRIETPDNSDGKLVQCPLGALVKDQDYECTVTGVVGNGSPVFTVSINGVVIEPDGHRHLSSRSFAVNNPQFDVEQFRAERRREAQAALAAGRTERASTNKK